MKQPHHPSDAELARYDEQAHVGPGGQHVLICRECRTTVAEYGWLRRELIAVLHGIADGPGVPRRGWEGVRRGTLRMRRRQLAGWYGTATFGIALVLCLAFATPLAGGESTALPGTVPSGRLDLPGAMAPPRAGAAERVRPSVTPTPSPPMPHERGQGLTPALEPIPTAPRLASG